MIAGLLTYVDSLYGFMAIECMQALISGLLLTDGPTLNQPRLKVTNICKCDIVHCQLTPES